MMYPPIRTGTTRNGNPVYRIPATVKGVFQEFVTMADASFVYSIMNDWKGSNMRGAVLTLTPSGRVRYLEYTD